MIIRTILQWADGTRHESTITASASRARYLMNARRSSDAAYRPLKDIKNGYQYETPRQNCGKAGKCITTVTLERGWA